MRGIVQERLPTPDSYIVNVNVKMEDEQMFRRQKTLNLMAESR